MQKTGTTKILVRSPNWIGDQILAYPFFHYLRQAYPRARIVVTCVRWVESVQFRDLVDEVLVLPRPLNRSLRARWAAIEEGAGIARDRGPFDLAIALPNSFSSAWFLFRSGAKRRRGYAADGRSLLLTERIGLPPGMLHRAQSYVNLLSGEFPDLPSADGFWGVPPETDLDEPIPGVLPEFAPEKAWADEKPVEPPGGPYWVLAPGSTAESRRWPERHFVELARRIAKSTGWKGLIIGGPSEAPVAAALCEDKSARLEDWTAQGTVASNWKIFRNAKLTVANDSGLAHVASLCGSPVQIVWGAGERRRTEPLGPGKVRVSFNPVECWPCERNSCSQPEGTKLQCLRGIHPDTVWKEIQSGFGIGAGERGPD